MVTSLLDLQEPSGMTVKAVNHIRCCFAQAHHIANHNVASTSSSAKCLPLIGLQLLVIAENMVNFWHV